MNCNDLLRVLHRVKDKSKDIMCFKNFDDMILITEVLEIEDKIIIGYDLPTELHEVDYKY